MVTGTKIFAIVTLACFGMQLKTVPYIFIILNFYLFCYRIKRGDNRDKRVELLQRYARENFPSVKYMEYAVQVETYTLSKANNLVLNVDGAIGSLFLDLLAGSGMFTKPEIDEIVGIGYLNGLFVLARSIGLIG